MNETLAGASPVHMTGQSWFPASETSAYDTAGAQNSSNSGPISIYDDEPGNVSNQPTANLIWIYVGPLIFLTGVCGNILILLVMHQGRMKGTSTCVYLQAMAIADLVAITTGIIPDWLHAQHIITLKETHQVLCKMEKLLHYTSADTSIWVCVVFTIDRFIAVCFPLENMRICPAHHAKFYAIGVFVAAVGKNLHVLITRGQEFKSVGNVTVFVSNCGSPNAEYKYFESFVRPWLVFTLINLLPFIIIIFCNLFIIREMISLRRSRRRSAIVSTRDTSTTTQMTVLCLSASICFLVCVTPTMILLIGKPYWASDNPSYDVAKSVSNLIFLVNHSINFFLYCMTGQKFRTELMLLCARNIPLVRSSTPRNSADLGYIYKLQRDRYVPGKGGKSGLYASAPCITNFTGCGTPSPGTPDKTRVCLNDIRGSNRPRTRSDANIVANYVLSRSAFSLIGKETRL